MKKTHATTIALTAAIAASLAPAAAWCAVVKKAVTVASDAREPREFSKTAKQVPVQKYEGTENDGTAQVIRPNMRPDENKPSEEFLTSAPVEKSELPAPKVISKKVTAEAAPAPTPAPSPAPVAAAEQPVTAPAPDAETAALLAEADALAGEKGDVAPGAENGAIGVDEVVESNPGAPTDLLSARMLEKLLVSKAVKKQLAHEQTVADKKADLAKRASSFDAVPDKRIPDLALRLKYTNEILKRYGRAYDYRITSLTQFKKVLAELEKDESKKTSKQ